MLIYDIIKDAETMRPGNDFSDIIFEKLIDELDARIQLDVGLKTPNEIVRTMPELWSEKPYKKGARVSKRMGGKTHVFVAIADTDEKKSPGFSDSVWKEVPYQTYVIAPFDRLYMYYIIAQMDYMNGDYNKFANDNERFESAYDEFARWWQRNYRTNKEGYDAVRADA